MKLSSFQLGKIAEYFVSFLYVLKLYKIKARRMKNFCGEIDLIAVRGHTIVFIEVKYRNHDIADYDAPIVSKKQISRIMRSAEIFIQQKNFLNYQVRFDLVVVKKNRFPIIIENAWGKDF